VIEKFRFRFRPNFGTFGFGSILGFGRSLFTTQHKLKLHIIQNVTHQNNENLRPKRAEI
jgi:hypothetical protein